MSANGRSCNSESQAKKIAPGWRISMGNPESKKI